MVYITLLILIILFFSKINRRMAHPTGAKIQWTGHDGGTQTQIHTSYDNKKDTEKKTSGGEVRVIVQPIQPVFYMPRQSKEKKII